MPDREGPVLVTPEPYLSCEGCKYYGYQSLEEYLADPDTEGEFFYESHKDQKCLKANRSLALWFRTPEWCPLLPKGQS